MCYARHTCVTSSSDSMRVPKNVRTFVVPRSTITTRPAFSHATHSSSWYSAGAENSYFHALGVETHKKVASGQIDLKRFQNVDDLLSYLDRDR